MIRSTLLITSAALAIAGTVSAETRDFPVQSFDRIDANHAIDVVYVQGNTASVSVEQDGGDFSDIRVDVEDGELVLKRVSMSGAFRRHSLSMRYDDGIKIARVNGKRVPTYMVHVTSPDLTALRASSSSYINATEIAADTLRAHVSSSSDISLSGAADHLILKASSSGDLSAQSLLAEKLTIDASSSGDISAAGTGGDVTIDASSSADVYVSGTCNELNVSASSSADIALENLVCTNGVITASSSADVDVFLTGTIDAKASSSSDITADGGPQVTRALESSGGDISIEG